MQLDPIETLARLATRRPLAGEVFARHGIDYASQGGATLASACAARALEPEVVLAEIGALEDTAAVAPVRWDLEPLAVVVDRAVADHAALRGALAMALRLGVGLGARGRGGGGGVGLDGILGTLARLADELHDHMAKEERVLFPWIRAGRGATAAAPIRAMCTEHDETMAHVARLRVAADGYRAPRPALADLYQHLEGIDRALRAHIHLENNVLFPRTLVG
jgi:regulator of cell morphogenesis and NO signaling